MCRIQLCCSQVLELCVGTPTAKILDVAKMAEKYLLRRVEKGYLSVGLSN